jgi:hypothetical protein
VQRISGAMLARKFQSLLFVFLPEKNLVLLDVAYDTRASFRQEVRTPIFSHGKGNRMRELRAITLSEKNQAHETVDRTRVARGNRWDCLFHDGTAQKPRKA